jgi:hypothetical protein
MDATNIQRTITVSASRLNVHCQSCWQYYGTCPLRCRYGPKSLLYTNDEYLRRAVYPQGRQSRI